MIKLEVQDYCQGCPKFEPDVERPVNLYADEGAEPYVTVGGHRDRMRVQVYLRAR